MKNQGFTLSPEDAFLEKPEMKGPSTLLGIKKYLKINHQLILVIVILY